MEERSTQLMPVAPAIALPDEPAGDVVTPPAGPCGCAACDARKAACDALERLDAINVTIVQRLQRAQRTPEWRAFVTLRDGRTADGNGHDETQALFEALQKLPAVPR